MALTARKPFSLVQVSFVVVMLGLMALFITLGTWQLERLGEKQALIAAVDARIDQAPVQFPAAQAWSSLDPAEWQFRPVSATGSFDAPNSVLIFTNLDDPQGPYGGVGFWVMTPLILEDGGLVWVNRGFVPQDLADSVPAPSPGTVTIEGVARQPELANPFTPAPDFEQRREWVRDPQRLSAFLQGGAEIAPITIDQAAGPEGALPQGGETTISFPNRHLEYAGTWYLFAAITPIMLGFWLWRQRRPSNLAHPDKAN